MTNNFQGGQTVLSTTFSHVQTDTGGSRDVSIYILTPDFKGGF